MGFNCLKAGATSRRQFISYHYVPKKFWYSFYRPRKDERQSWPWSHPVALNTGSLDWESSALTTRPLFHKASGCSLISWIISSSLDLLSVCSIIIILSMQLLHLMLLDCHSYKEFMPYYALLSKVSALLPSYTSFLNMDILLIIWRKKLRKRSLLIYSQQSAATYFDFQNWCILRKPNTYNNNTHYLIK